MFFAGRDVQTISLVCFILVKDFNWARCGGRYIYLHMIYIYIYTYDIRNPSAVHGTLCFFDINLQWLANVQFDV